MQTGWGMFTSLTIINRRDCWSHGPTFSEIV
jgi:hypothetical protein